MDLKDARRKKAELADPLRQDRIPPHSIEAEQGVLGCILMEPSSCIGECIEKLAGPDVFYDLRHRSIYTSVLDMHDAKQAIDTITLQQWLKDRKILEECGGLVYLATLPDAVPSAANIGYYIEIVREKHVLRKLIATCTDIVARSYEHTGTVEAILDTVAIDIQSVVDGASYAGDELKSASTLVVAAQQRIEQIESNQGLPTGIATGFIDFDKMTGGLNQGEMTVIAARPSVGKTALAMNVADHIAITSGIPVGVFSLEMTAESLMMRMMCSRARVSLFHIRDGIATAEDMGRLSTASMQLAKSPIYIDDMNGPSVQRLYARAERITKKHGVKVWIVDYLQLLHSPKRNLRSKEEEISDISTGLKWMARDLNVAVLVLSQLNREVEHRKPGSRPQLSDLRGSGSIEQDADLVGLLHRTDMFEEYGGQSCLTSLIIAKQRNGPCGDVNLVFLKPYTRFEAAVAPHSIEQTAVNNEP